jgi:hypothetical protein
MYSPCGREGFSWDPEPLLRPDGNHSSLRHRFPRVQDQVPDDLPDLRAVHLRQPEIVGQEEIAPTREPLTAGRMDS